MMKLISLAASLLRHEKLPSLLSGRWQAQEQLEYRHQPDSPDGILAFAI